MNLHEQSDLFKSYEWIRKLAVHQNIRHAVTIGNRVQVTEDFLKRLEMQGTLTDELKQELKNLIAVNF